MVGDSDHEWTQDERADFREKLRAFRADLPEQQQKAFSQMIAGAAVAYRLGADRFGDSKKDRSEEGASFLQALTSFRDGLPPRQRDAVTSIVTAGSIAWAVADVQRGEREPHPRQPDGDGTIASAGIPWWIELGPAMAIIAVGAYLVINELTEEEEAEAPEIYIPPSPEIPD